MKKLFILLLFMPCWCWGQNFEGKFIYYNDLFVSCDDTLKTISPLAETKKWGDTWFRRQDYLDSAKKYWNLWHDENVEGMKDALQEIELKKDLEKLRLEKGGGVPGPIGISFDSANATISSGKIYFGEAGIIEDTIVIPTKKYIDDYPYSNEDLFLNRKCKWKYLFYNPN